MRGNKSPFMTHKLVFAFGNHNMTNWFLIPISPWGRGERLAAKLGSGRFFESAVWAGRYI